jgi:hypothetical protein
MFDSSRWGGDKATEFRWNRGRLKITVSWLAAAAGVLIGVFSLVVSGMTSLEDPKWLGFGLLGLAFVFGSIVSVRDRRCAGIALMLAAPIVAFCGGYPESRLWVEDPHGAFPILLAPPLAVALEALFFMPVAAAMLVVQRGKRAILLLVLSVAAAGAAFAISEWIRVLFRELMAWSILLIGFGGLWLGACRSGWPPLLADRRKLLRQRLGIALLVIVCVAFVTLTSIFVVSSRRSTIDVLGDGSGPRLYGRPWRPDYAVFTAKLIRVGHTARISGQWAGKWAIGRVQEDFGGRPWRFFPFVLLRGSVFAEGESYLIDGFRTAEALTTFLPVVEAGSGLSTLTLPVSDCRARMELSLLRRPPRPGDLWIVGQVVKAARSHDPFEPHLPLTGTRESSGRSPDVVDSEGVYHRLSNYRRWQRSPWAGGRIRVTGASGTMMMATTNGDGFYLLAGLRPDRYTLHFLDLPEGRCATEITVEKEELVRSELYELRSTLFWCDAP